MVSGGLGIAGGIDQCLIPKAQLVPAIFLAASLQQAPDQGNDMPGDLVPIAGDVLGAIINAAQTTVSERGVSVETQLARHAMAKR